MRDYLLGLSNHLISLKDDGYKIICNNTSITITNDYFFTYDLIKTELIPFITYLDKDHDIIIKVNGYTKSKFFGIIPPKYVTNYIKRKNIIKDKYKPNLIIGQLDIIITKKMPKDVEKFINDFMKI